MRFLHELPDGSIDIAIDVGAAHGSYAWILSRKARDVYSFEPGSQHADYLARCTDGTNIHLVRSAVGSTYKTVEMYTPGADSSALHSATLSVENPVVADSRTTVQRVEQVTLDGEFLGRKDSNRSIDLLKIDVEGYEMQVVEGASGLLRKHFPLVICEIEVRHNARYGEVFAVLRSLGYRAYIFRDGEFEAFDGQDVSELQTDADLEYRLGPDYQPGKNRYINNFTFQHESSRVKVTT